MACGPCAPRAAAEDIPGTPKDFIAKAGKLKPGDTLRLAPGEYTGLLRIIDKHGLPDAPITITGPNPPAQAVLIGRAGLNTIELAGASWIVLRNLTLDGRGVADDGIKATDTHRRPVHHVTLEGNTIVGHGRGQDFVGISTKVPCWDWTIRRNTIIGAGTGMYLGNSDGKEPFVRGVVEYNLVQNPTGYCIQIKHQNARPTLEGLPTEPSSTLIRYNVLIKDDAHGVRGDRPNLLVDGWPDAGPGSQDRYEIYGNVFYYNPRESLFQGTGRFTLHDNVFVLAGRAAVMVQPHTGKKPRSVRIYHNTFLTEGREIQVSGQEAKGEMLVAGNLVCSGLVKPSMRLDLGANAYFSRQDAETVFASPSLALGRVDLQPKARIAMPMPPGFAEAVKSDVDWDLDFSGSLKGDPGYAGAFSQPFQKPSPIDAILRPLIRR